MKRGLRLFAPALLSVCVILSFVDLARGQGPDDPLAIHAQETARAAALDAQNAIAAATAKANATRQALGVQQTQQALSAQATQASRNATAAAQAQSDSATRVSAGATEAASARMTWTSQTIAAAQFTAAARAVSQSGTATVAMQQANATATIRSQDANATEAIRSQDARAAATVRMQHAQETAVVYANNVEATRTSAQATATRQAEAVQEAQNKERWTMTLEFARNYLATPIAMMLLLLGLVWGTYRHIRRGDDWGEYLRRSFAPFAGAVGLLWGFFLHTDDLRDFVLMTVVPIALAAILLWALYRYLEAKTLQAQTLRGADGTPFVFRDNTIYAPSRMPGAALTFTRPEALPPQIAAHVVDADVTKRDQAISLMRAATAGQGGRAGDAGELIEAMTEEPRMQIVNEPPQQLVGNDVPKLLEAQWKEVNSNANQ